MQEPKIVQHDTPEEVDGAYAYYDRDTNEIHILKPDPLYARILSHEQHHAHAGLVARSLIRVSDSTTLGMSITLMVLAIMFSAISLMIHQTLVQFPLEWTFLYLAGMVTTVPLLLILGVLLPSFEEYLTEYVTRREAKQSRTSQVPDTGPSSPGHAESSDP